MIVLGIKAASFQESKSNRKNIVVLESQVVRRSTGNSAWSNDHDNEQETWSI